MSKSARHFWNIYLSLQKWIKKKDFSLSFPIKSLCKSLRATAWVKFGEKILAGEFAINLLNLLKVQFTTWGAETDYVNKKTPLVLKERTSFCNISLISRQLTCTCYSPLILRSIKKPYLYYCLSLVINLPGDPQGIPWPLWTTSRSSPGPCDPRGSLDLDPIYITPENFPLALCKMLSTVLLLQNGFEY